MVVQGLKELSVIRVGHFVLIFHILAEVTSEHSLQVEIEREIQAFHERGIPIDRATAQKIVKHRRRILQGKEKSIEYIYEAKTLANALERLAVVLKVKTQGDLYEKSNRSLDNRILYPQPGPALPAKSPENPGGFYDTVSHATRCMILSIS